MLITLQLAATVDNQLDDHYIISIFVSDSQSISNPVQAECGHADVQVDDRYAGLSPDFFSRGGLWDRTLKLIHDIKES